MRLPARAGRRVVAWTGLDEVTLGKTRGARRAKTHTSGAVSGGARADGGGERRDRQAPQSARGKVGKKVRKLKGWWRAMLVCSNEESPMNACGRGWLSPHG